MTYFKKRPFILSLHKDKGYFDIYLFDKPMLGTKLTAMIGKKKAKLVKAEESSAVDEWGSHDLWTLLYEDPSNTQRGFTAIIRSYDTFTFFETKPSFEIKAKKHKHLFGHPYISFPCFEGELWDQNCSSLTFKRQAPFNYPQQWQGKVVDCLREGKNSPLMITNSSYETVVLSPLNHLLYGTVSISQHPKAIRCGIPRALTIPEATSIETVMVYGKGVNKTLENWGKLLQKRHGTLPVSSQADVQLKYLSYWTNAGSAYWYNTHRKTSYETTFRKLKNHHDKIGLSFGSYQLDSWWYKKEGDDYTSGILHWEPKVKTNSKNFNAMLPFFQKYRSLTLFSEDRLSFVQEILNKPIGCHFKQLANDAIYVKEKEEDFIVEDFPMPKNYRAGRALFDQVFNHPRWRMSFVVHDWLSYMNDRHSGFRHIGVGSDYFKAFNDSCMAIEAEDNECGHLTAQLCMTQPHMTLNSVTMPCVTSIRSTSDANSFFIEGPKRWSWHLFSSKFIQVLGKYPYYDNRMSSKRFLHPASSYPRFEFIWLALSCGPIGIGDKIGSENMALIRRTIKEDGQVIKPDVPASPLDRCYLFNPHSLNGKEGVTVFSYSIIACDRNAYYKVFYFLSFNTHPFGRKVGVTYRIDEACHGAQGTYALYDYKSGEMKLVASEDEMTYALKGRQFKYLIAAPVRNGFAYIGDISKHICASNQLVQGISFDQKSIKIDLIHQDNYRPGKMMAYSQKVPKKIKYGG